MMTAADDAGRRIPLVNIAPPPLMFMCHAGRGHKRWLVIGC
jgi:hypothetical protein